MIGVKKPDQALSTKISMNSNLVPNEQRGVGLIFLDNIHVEDETSLDTRGSETGEVKVETLPDAITHVYQRCLSLSLLCFVLPFCDKFKQFTASGQLVTLQCVSCHSS